MDKINIVEKINIQLSFEGVPEAVTAGRTIKGVLKLVAPRSVKAHHLKVYFMGEEYTKVYVRRGQRVRTYHEDHEITRVDIPAPKLNDLLERNDHRLLPEGEYKVPFSIRISSGLPSSVAFGDCNDSTKIEYALVAEMFGSGIIHDYQARHVIQVNARPKSIKKVPFAVPPQCHTIVGGLFFNRGKVEFGAQADDTLLVPGQRIQLDLAIVNESLASIHKIRVTLHEKADWTARENKRETHSASKTICLFDETMDASSVGLKKDPKHLKQQVRESFRMRQNFNLIEEQLLAATNDNDNHQTSNVLSLTLPPVPKVAHNSYKGSHMEVRHELIVTLETHAVNSNPEFVIPIRIARGRPSQLAAAGITDFVP